MTDLLILEHRWEGNGIMTKKTHTDAGTSMAKGVGGGTTEFCFDGSGV